MSLEELSKWKCDISMGHMKKKSVLIFMELVEYILTQVPRLCFCVLNIARASAIAIIAAPEKILAYDNYTSYLSQIIFSNK